MSDDSELVERVKVILLKVEGHAEWEELAPHWDRTYTAMARAAIAEVQRYLDLPPTKSEMELRLELERTQAEVVHTQDELGNLLHAAEAKLAEVQRWRPIAEAKQERDKRLWLFQSGRGGFEGWWHDFGPDGQGWQDDSDSEPAPTHFMERPAPPQI